MDGGSNNGGSRIAALGGHFAALFVIFLFCLLFIFAHGHRDVIYSSDSVQPYMLARDLIHNFRSIRDWYLSASPYVFPDMLLSAGVLTLPLPNIALPIVYGPVLLSLYCFAVGSLLAGVTASRFSSAVWIFAALLLAALSGTMLIAPAGVGAQFMSDLACPFQHSGAVLSTLLALALYMSSWPEPPTRWRLALAVVLVFTAGFSDTLFVVWFALPMAVLWVLQAWINRSSQTLRQALILLVCGGGGVVLDYAINNGVVGIPQRGNVVDALLAFLGTASDAVTNGDVPFCEIFALMALLLIRSAWLLVASLRRLELSKPDQLELLLGLIAAAALAAPILGRLYHNPAHMRYLLIAPILAVLWIALWTIRVLGTRHRWTSIAPKAAALLIGLALIPGSRVAMAQTIAPTPLQSCLLVAGRTTGIGDYWTAKKLMFASDGAIHIVQITPDGQLYRWDYNSKWFDNRSDGSGPAKPNFIVVSRLDQAKLLALFGAQDEILHCAGEDVWLYSKALQALG